MLTKISIQQMRTLFDRRLKESCDEQPSNYGNGVSVRLDCGRSRVASASCAFDRQGCGSRRASTSLAPPMLFGSPSPRNWGRRGMALRWPARACPSCRLPVSAADAALDRLPLPEEKGADRRQPQARFSVAVGATRRSRRPNRPQKLPSAIGSMLRPARRAEGHRFASAKRN